MASGTFEKTNISWQLQQLQQRISEWLERVFARPPDRDGATPNWQIPDWLQKGLFWFMVVGLILWAGWQLYRLLRPYLSSGFRSSNFTPPLAPVSTTKLMVSDWLKRSRQFQQQGNYREACRALYMATLQQLNDNSLVRQESSRTDGEYLRLIQEISASQPYQLLIQTHERLCFSDADISVEIFDRCWLAYQEIERTGNTS